MCASMVDIQSATAEIRRGKKKEERKKVQTTGRKYKWPALLHRAAIKTRRPASADRTARATKFRAGLRGDVGL